MKEMWESFVNAFVRFWDNRFLVDDEIEFLRQQLSLIKHENQKLLNHILAIINSTDNLEEIKNFEPVGKGYQTWSVRKAQLEMQSRLKYNSIKSNPDNIKSTNDLERELLPVSSTKE